MRYYEYFSVFWVLTLITDRDVEFYLVVKRGFMVCSQFTNDNNIEVGLDFMTATHHQLLNN